MNNIEWVLVDTETTGFQTPIYAIEIGAQRMRGWEAEGKPFRRLLNHNADIPAEASRVNGYTREILERDGDPPRDVYDAFADYAGDCPIVAYNLSYDLDEVLKPEWQRLGIAPIGRPGFCALRLAQRLLDPVPAGNCKLQTLRQYYRLPERGAHTALGDVETVADLMQKVLKPLAEQRGLNTWEDICKFSSSPWYPARIAFGKFKGRDYRDAREDSDLRGWLQWLAEADNPRSAKMGRWYLRQLETETKDATDKPFVDPEKTRGGTGVAVYLDIELATIKRLIAAARDRLAELESDYTEEHHAVEVVTSQLFEMLRPHYQRRDELRLVVKFRQEYIDALLVDGEDEAEEVEPRFEQARDEAKQEYEEAATRAADRKPLTEHEETELKAIFLKLVRLYHPDRYAHDPAMQAVYSRLTSEINDARDRGDIARLREIATDPEGFLSREGMSGLDFTDDAELASLRQLYDSLQLRIVELIETLETLRDSSDYELLRLSRERPEFLDEVANAQAKEVQAEISELEAMAQQLADEIENLTGQPDILGGNVAG